MITDRRKFTCKWIEVVPLRDVLFPFLPLESIQSFSPGLYAAYKKPAPNFYVIFLTTYCIDNAYISQSHAANQSPSTIESRDIRPFLYYVGKYRLLWWTEYRGLSVCLSVVSPVENSECDRDNFAFRTRVGPGKHLLHIADLFEANTVLCSINTIQPPSI